jgi:hypothetical protein
MSRTMWRIAPPPHLAEAVRKLALAEARTDSGMITKLISEALAGRRATETKVDRLVDAFRGLASADNTTQ